MEPTERGAFSWAEIRTQARSWQGALRAVEAHREALAGWLEGVRGRGLVFTGCGSTHYLAQYAAAWFQTLTGWRCRGLPASELVWQTDAWLAPEEAPGVVALSRSGETSETILAVEQLAARGCPTLTVGCYGDAPLARICQQVVEVTEGREESFAQTRSFAGMLVAVQALGALAAGDAGLRDELAVLPALADTLITRAQPLASAWGRDESIRRITYLGSGALFGLANEATVKMKEMSLSVAEAYPFMEFRHGPMALVDSEHLAVGLMSDAMGAYERSVLADLKARGARILAIGEDTANVAGIADARLDLASGLPERARSVLYLPLLQLLAFHRAMGRGLNPDRPRNVVMAIRLDGTGMVPDA